MTRKTPDQLRSARWFAPDDFRSFGHRSRAMQMGWDHDDWQGKPVIAIVNTIHLHVGDEELAARRAGWTPPPRRFERGYGWMFTQHILQADRGCDFDYLETSFGAPIGEPAIY